MPGDNSDLPYKANCHPKQTTQFSISALILLKIWEEQTIHTAPHESSHSLFIGLDLYYCLRILYLEEIKTSRRSYKYPEGQIYSKDSTAHCSGTRGDTYQAFAMLQVDPTNYLFLKKNIGDQFS